MKEETEKHKTNPSKPKLIIMSENQVGLKRFLKAKTMLIKEVHFTSPSMSVLLWKLGLLTSPTVDDSLLYLASQDCSLFSFLPRVKFPLFFF